MLTVPWRWKPPENGRTMANTPPPRADRDRLRWVRGCTGRRRLHAAGLCGPVDAHRCRQRNCVGENSRKHSQTPGAGQQQSASSSWQNLTRQSNGCSSHMDVVGSLFPLPPLSLLYPLSGQYIALLILCLSPVIGCVTVCVFLRG